MALALERSAAIPREVPERRYLEPAAAFGRREAAMAGAGLAIAVALVAWRLYGPPRGR
jgi:hypothetical protein